MMISSAKTTHFGKHITAVQIITKVFFVMAKSNTVTHLGTTFQLGTSLNFITHTSLTVMISQTKYFYQVLHAQI